ncbi:unnamed protein product [Kluyveromyces dobzhanskii CBS 2104]|uniref:Branchpoint-bridging protein n=1 Tax=Kluyveromyces dobzhanskii CBS 2104 TaxID=1427455 RepID=A0A0A8LAU6_9SACH|nr:unnamed protein product [Kluyveromyces dobzhanskii CBS 2104]
MERGRTNNQYDSLWGAKASENSSFEKIGLPAVINGFLSAEHETAFQVMFRIAEITAKLTSNELNPPSGRARSPSPPPVYDSRGRRTNTREQRYKRKLEEERHRLVEIALRMIPNFVTPADYRRPTRFLDKYYIPTEDHPEINFVGLLLGPRGNTLKMLQQESGCKISIRGRGSVRSGKAAADLPKGAMDMNEPLHCIIIADVEDKIPLGIKACERIVVKAITSPEGQNDLKRGQLRELAVLNGTLREDNYVQTFGRKRIGTEDESDKAKRFKNAESFIPDQNLVANSLPVNSSMNITQGRTGNEVVPPSMGSTFVDGSSSFTSTRSQSAVAEHSPSGIHPIVSNSIATTPPGMLSPGIGAPGLAAPGVAAPGLAAPGLAAPGLAAPGLAAPGLAAPGLAAPGLAAPGLAAPGLAAPGLVAPGIVAPGIATSRIVTPNSSSNDRADDGSTN